MGSPKGSPPMKKIPELKNILKDIEFTKKVFIYMSTKAGGDDYDNFEGNYVYTELNPIPIKAYVREVSAEALVYKQYGLHQMGAVELICEARYKNYFLNSNKIVIDSVTYQVFKEGGGNRTYIQDRPYNLIRVVLSRNG